MKTKGVSPSQNKRESHPTELKTSPLAAGKTTLLRNIISQNPVRVVGPPGNPHHIPMIIFDGKCDLEGFCRKVKKFNCKQAMRCARMHANAHRLQKHISDLPGKRLLKSDFNEESRDEAAWDVGVAIGDLNSHAFFGGGKDVSMVEVPEPGSTYYSITR